MELAWSSLNTCAVTELALRSSKENRDWELGSAPQRVSGKQLKDWCLMQRLESRLTPHSRAVVSTPFDAAPCAGNHRDVFSFPRRAAVVAARKRGERRAPASLPKNFVLVGRTAPGGIKLGTVRGESTPRTRAATTFRPQTDKDSSKPTQPGRTPRGVAAESSRPGLPPEGPTLCEGQGGPR